MQRNSTWQTAPGRQEAAVGRQICDCGRAGRSWWPAAGQRAGQRRWWFKQAAWAGHSAPEVGLLPATCVFRRWEVYREWKLRL